MSSNALAYDTIYRHQNKSMSIITKNGSWSQSVCAQDEHAPDTNPNNGLTYRNAGYCTLNDTPLRTLLIDASADTDDFFTVTDGQALSPNNAEDGVVADSPVFNGDGLRLNVTTASGAAYLFGALLIQDAFPDVGEGPSISTSISASIPVLTIAEAF